MSRWEFCTWVAIIEDIDPDVGMTLTLEVDEDPLMVVALGFDDSQGLTELQWQVG